MNRTTLGAVGAIALTASIAFACKPSVTSAPTAKSSVAVRAQDGSITNRGAELTFYEKAKNGYHTTTAAYYADKDLSISVTNADITFQPAKAGLTTEAGDDTQGEEDGHTTMAVAVKGGTPHKIVLDEADFPPMGDHDNQMTVIDLTDAAPLATAAQTQAGGITYTCDQDFTHFTAKSAKGGQLDLRLNPDGSYTINGEGANGEVAAADLVRRAGVYKGASLESISALYARLIKREQAASTLIGMNGAPADPAPLLKEIIQEIEAGKTF